MPTDSAISHEGTSKFVSKSRSFGQRLSKLIFKKNSNRKKPEAFDELLEQEKVRTLFLGELIIVFPNQANRLAPLSYWSADGVSERGLLERSFQVSGLLSELFGGSEPGSMRQYRLLKRFSRLERKIRFHRQRLLNHCV